jgi:hypothetical protein
MPLPEEQVWRWRARDALERDGDSLEGALGSRSRQSLARGRRPAPERGGVPLEGRPTLERDGTSPEGKTGPRARRSCTGVAPCPSSGAEFRPTVARPIVWWVVGPWICFARVFRFVCVCFFYEFKWVFPGCLGDPHGCPRHTPCATSRRATPRRLRRRTPGAHTEAPQGPPVRGRHRGLCVPKEHDARAWT